MSDDTLKRNGWVCPNDRGLTLLAKLGIGWSSKSQYHNSEPYHHRPRPQPLTSSELDLINNVMKKAEEHDIKERTRIRYIVDRVEKLRKSARGSGRNYCHLCGDPCLLYRLFSPKRSQCSRCLKNVCSKCGQETLGLNKASVWRCKICYEELDMIRKTGVWFYSVSQ